MKKLITEDAKKATPKQIEAIVKSTTLNKSQKMKALFDIGVEIKEITTLLTEHEGKLVRYNFVYNVISNYCNMNGIAVESEEKEGKKDQIIAMYLAGKSNKDISITLKTNSNYVFNVLKKYKAENPVAAATETPAEAVTEEPTEAPVINLKKVGDL